MILLVWNVQSTVLLVLPAITKLGGFWQEVAVYVLMALLISILMVVVRLVTIHVLVAMEFLTPIVILVHQIEHY